MNKDNVEFDPTFDGVSVLILSFIILGYGVTTFQFGETTFNIVLTAGLLGTVGGLLDVFGYIDMSDYVDIQNIEQANSTGGAKGDSQEKSEKETKEVSKTPPVKQRKKDELYYKRAKRKCEQCKEYVDQHHVHHIVARADGGPNTNSNLMVLCPNCHSKADAGLLSKSKLRFRVREQNKKWDERKKS
jgi:hypothetical protein